MWLRRAWQNILKHLPGSAKKTPIQKVRRARPLVEVLEDRLVPTTWFVATFGSDGNAGSNPSAPFSSIQHAVNVAQNGDRIEVAAGVYGYNPAADQINDDARFTSHDPNNHLTISGTVLSISPAVVLVYDKAVSIFGGFDSTFTNWSPSTNRTYINGGGTYRGVYVQAFNEDISFDMEGFTVMDGVAHGEPGVTGLDTINAFGGGMWVTALNRANSGTPGTYILRNMVFRTNFAGGNNTNDVGGAGSGSALALRYVPNMILDHVTFDSNVSEGGTGVTRGGAAFGAVQLDHSNVTGNTLTFYNNRAIGGASNGAGIDSGFQTADALGAGFSEVDSSANLTDVIALGNSATGGAAPNGTPGSAFGGGLYAEAGNLTLVNANVRSNLVQGGSGQNANGSGGFAAGGGIAVENGNLSLNQVQSINNVVVGGNGAVKAGAPGGGGVWVQRNGTGVSLSVNVLNTVIADNSVSFSGSGDTSAGGGGGGLWLQGVNANFTHATFANNHLGPNLINGQAIVLLSGTNGSGGSIGTAATLTDVIIADHINGNRAAALTVLSQSPNNSVTLNHVLYANNTKSDNSDGLPDPAGVYNGLGTVIRADNAFFTSPGGPNFDYSIQPNSPAVGQGAGGTATDIEGNPYTAPDLGAYAVPPAPRAHITVALFDPETAIWQIRLSNSGGFFPDGPVFTYGSGGGLSKPVVGDWNGDGQTTIGVVEVKAYDFNGKPFLTNAQGTPIPVSVFELKNTNGPGGPDIVVPYGSFSATPVVGNWDNNPQHIDHIGVVEIENGVAVWKLRNSFTSGGPDISFAYGGVTSIPVVGDWNGDGITTMGVVENNGGILAWKLRNSFSPGAPDAGDYGYGLSYMQPIVGDWNNDGQTTGGVYDPTTGLWQLRNENNPGAPDAGKFYFGPSFGSDFNAEPLIALTGDFAGLS